MLYRIGLLFALITWLSQAGMLSRSYADDAIGAGALAVEAEALVGLHADANKWRVTSYEHASGQASLYPQGQPIIWNVMPEQAGTYYFWVRVRSGWNGDHHMHEQDNARYTVALGSRQVAMESMRQTLDWYGDGHNFIWLRSEPLNLDSVEQTITVLAKWEWAHVDRLVLTGDGSYSPGLGNVSANELLAGRLQWWTGSPYVHPLPPNLVKPEDAGTTLSLVGPRGGTACGALFTRLESDSSTTVPFRLAVRSLKGPGGQTLPASVLKISSVATTGMLVGSSLATDALPEINAMGAFELAPSTTRMFWVMVQLADDMMPGEYVGTIEIENQISLKIQAVRVRLLVSQTAIQPQMDDLAVFSWWGYHSAPDSWWDDQIAHGINSFLLNVHHDLRYQFNEQGQLEEPIDFSNLEKLVDTLQKNKGWVLVNWYLHDATRATLICQSPGSEPGAALPMLSEPWKKAFATILEQTQAYLESQGIPRDRILHYTFDEYLGDRFVAVGKLIRSLDPTYRIFSDLSADLKTYKSVAPYVDVWCPFFDDLETMDADGRLAFMRSTGKPIWFYDPGYTQRGASPYTKFRVKFWRAWRYKLDGCTYWKHQGDRVGTAYYPMVEGDPPVTSRRYEAWFSGWQDYQLLEQMADVCRGGSAMAEEAYALLNEAVEQVCDHPTDVTLADHYRRKMLALLDDVAAAQPK